MADRVVEQDAVFLAAGMGLGKTAACLWAVRRLFALGTVRKVLIVAPLNVAENTWPDEIAAWTFARDFKYTVITGTDAERRAALEWGGDIHIINRENLRWLKSYWGVRGWPYDMLIYDEASRLKGGNKRSTPNVRKDGSTGNANLTEFGILAQMRFTFKKVVLLSGTPAPNGLIDLWGPMYVIDRGSRLGTNITAFRNRWFQYDTYKRRYNPFDHSKGEITDLISDVFYSLKKEDYLTLPELIIRDHKVVLPKKAMDLYRRFERDLVLREFDLEAVNAGVLTNKLLQLANGSLYLDDHSAEHIHDAKLDALDSIITEACGQPVLLAYSYQFDVPRIMKRFPQARVFEGRREMLDWNAGKIPLLITHPASAGHGMNFQHGGAISVWYGLNWSLELYEQFRDRLHRSGQQADFVTMHRILAYGTADYSVARALDRKSVEQDDITDAVRVDVSNHSVRIAA